jgi:TolB-like protein/Tfp pilus assembly protein PilF
VAVAVAVAMVLLAFVGGWLYSRARRQPEIASLIVLPFVNESADQNLDYLSDGIAESVINNLTQLNSLRVLARTTAFRYKGRAADPQAVGKELQVKVVLTGTVARRGETLIVQADLVNVSDGSQLWGKQYNLKTTDALTVQQSISREIADTLRLKLTNEQERRLAKNTPVNPDAYQHYLRGRYHWNRRTVAEIKKSIELFQQAIAADPGYALAYSGLADAYFSLSNTHLSPNDAIPLARAAATKALELDDQLAEAHTSLGVIKWRYEWDWKGAETDFKRAFQLNPNYSITSQRYGLLLVYQKKFAAGRAELLKAQQLDPLSLTISSNVGLSYYFERQYDSAIEQLHRTLELDQNFPYAHFFLGWAWEQKKDFTQAIAAFQRATQIDRTPITIAYLAHGYAVSGNRAEAEKILDSLQRQSATGYVSPYYMAVICAGLGQNERSLEYLQRGLADHSDSMVLLGVEPKFDGLRSSPRFHEILNRVGLTP